MKVRGINLVWETWRNAVEEKLKTLLGVEELDNSDPQCFQQNNATAKLALEKMSIEERAEMDLAVETCRAEGNPEQVQYIYFSNSDRIYIQH